MNNMIRMWRIAALLAVIGFSMAGCENPTGGSSGKTFTVTFDSGNGSAVPSQDVKSGEKVTEPQNVTRGGYTLDGWYLDSAFKNKWDFAADTVTADITLYAKWNQIAAGALELAGTVTISAEGNSFTINTELTATYTGNETVTYQWNKDSAAVSGATSAKFTPTTEGSYTVTVSAAGYNPKTSAAVTVTTSGGGVVSVIPIANAEIEITAPVKGSAPETTATTDEENFTIGAVTWSPDDNPFKGGEEYTVTVTLTANSGHTFTGLSHPTVNGQDAQDDNTTEDVAAANFASHNITAAPSHGDHLVHSTSNGHPVTIKYGSQLTQNTGNLTVNAKAINVTGITIDAIAAQNYTGSAFTPAVTVKDGATTLESPADYTVSYSNNTDAGTADVTITGAGNYSGTRTENFTINKADPTVTWPTGLTAAFGETLADISLPGNGASTPAGTFTWTTPSTSVGALGVQSHNMTFTPNDAANYNTVTQNVNITVNKANPTVSTWPTAAAITYGAALSTSALTGGVGEGAFAWTNGTVIPTVTNSGYEVTFTPTDTAIYNPLTHNVSITVNKANPNVTWPTGLTAVYGETLEDISLASYTNTPAGTFTWTEAGTTSAGALGAQSHNMTFTPTDTANYHTVTDDVNIRVLLGVEMVSVSGGSFQMGKNLGTVQDTTHVDVTPVHTVTLSGFSIGKYQVTQEQYQTVMGSNPSNFKTGVTTGEIQNRRPVEMVSWYDAVVFCNKLSIAEGLTPAYRISDSTNPDDWGTVPTSSDVTWNAVTIDNNADGYRLPTEAQWEYAAKGGDPTTAGWVGYTYAGSNTVGDVAWYTSNSGSATHEVGKKAPNGLGLYDMSGNVREWCWDWYVATYPSSEAQTDPTGASSGSYRVDRGGNWGSSVGNVRSASRNNYNPSFRFNYLGFRLVRSYSEE